MLKSETRPQTVAVIMQPLTVEQSAEVTATLKEYRDGITTEEECFNLLLNATCWKLRPARNR